MMRVALYARVSTDDQDETLQLPTLRDYAGTRGWEVVKEYTDKASGKDANRPGWLALKSDLRAENIQAVVVVKLDRVMRSLTLFVKELEEFQKLGVSIIALNYGVLDPSNASGKLTIEIMAAVAEWEREINAERTREALAARKARGVKLGRPKIRLPIHQLALAHLHEQNWSKAAASVGLPRTTVMYHKKEILEEEEIIRLNIKVKLYQTKNGH